MQGPATPIDHHRGPDGEGFEDDVAERLGEEGRHDDGPGAVEETGQGRPAEQALEMDVRQPVGQLAQLGLVGPGPRDPQVDLGQEPHHRDQALKALHPDQPSRGGQVGACRRLGRLVLDPLRPVVGQEIRQVDHRGVDAPATVLLQRVAAREDQRVEFPQSPVDRPGVPPGLRGAASGHGASEAGRGVARLAAVLPEQVHRADQPVLVGRHQPDGRAPHAAARPGRRPARCCGSARRRYRPRRAPRGAASALK